MYILLLLKFKTKKNVKTNFIILNYLKKSNKYNYIYKNIS